MMIHADTLVSQALKPLITSPGIAPDKVIRTVEVENLS